MARSWYAKTLDSTGQLMCWGSSSISAGEGESAHTLTARPALVVDVPKWHHKVAAGVVVEMTQGEKDDAIDPTEPPESSGGGVGAQYHFSADMFELPNNADWAVNALAELDYDEDNDGYAVRLHDDTTEEGIGFTCYIPSGMTDMTLSFESRCITAPGGAKKVGLRLYERGSDDAWSAANALTDLDITTSEDYMHDSETKTLASLSLTAGNVYQFQLTRNPGVADDLTGDWALKDLIVAFS